MKGKLLIPVILLAALVLSACSKTSVPSWEEQVRVKEAPETQEVLSQTLDASRAYIDLRLRTDELLLQPATYADYETWSSDLVSLISEWEALEESSSQLEDLADSYIKEKISLNLIPTAEAVTSKEINDVFDKAPAGKKIKTLAKFLGVDAKRAYLILKQTQNEVEADAWNEAGDTFKKLENSAIVIKDGCKIAGFVGGVILTGGASGFAAAGVVTKTAVVVSGADLVLEVTEDAANISLGDDNEISEIAGDVRKITEPAAAILAIADMPKNLTTGIDKLNAWMFGADQFRSVVQDGKVIGIALPAYSKEKGDSNIKVTELDPENVEGWVMEQGEEGENIIVENGETDLNPEGETIEINNTDNQAESEAKESNSSDIVTAKSSDGKVTASFISPEGNTFIPSQARMWKVEVDNFDYQDGAASYTCDFVFYLDGARYQEMLDNRGCAFTSTFIDKPGNLLAQATVKFVKSRAVFDESGNFVELAKDVFETITLERNFVVEK